MLIATACDRTTVDEHIERAQSEARQGSHRAAIIELKNAARKEPDNAEVRLLLGRSHAESGENLDALDELERAKRLGIDEAATLPDLMRVKNRLGRHNEVIDELAEREALSDDLILQLADAYLAVDDLLAAERLYVRIPQEPLAKMGLATIAWMRGDNTGAQALFDDGLELDEKSTPLLLRKGEFQLVTGQNEQALQSFRTAATLPGGKLTGPIGVARALLAMERPDEALEQVRGVLAAAPNLPVARYLEGLIHYQRGNLADAEEALLIVRKFQPGHASSMYLLGAVKLQQGQLYQAEDYLESYLARNRGNESAAKMLATVKFRQGDFAETARVLAPYSQTSNDAQLVGLAGTAFLRSGETQAALDYLQRAAELAPDNTVFRNELALGLVLSGESERAVVELQSTIEIEQEQFNRDFLIALLQLRNGDDTAAMASAQALLASAEDSALVHNLIGTIWLARGDPDEAAEAFELAVLADPGFLPAIDNLVKLRPGAEDAVARYAQAVSARPNREESYLRLAEASLRDGQIERAEQVLRQAVEVPNAEMLKARLALARLYLQQNRLASAVEALAGAGDRAAGRPEFQVLAGETALRQRRRDDAYQIGVRLAQSIRQHPASRYVLLDVARLQRQVKLYEKADETLGLARQLGDTDGLVDLEWIRVALARGDVNAAAERLDTLPEEADAESVGLLRADVQSARGQLDDAAESYTRLAAGGSRVALFKLAEIAATQGTPQDALGPITEWLDGDANDTRVRILFADTLLRTGQKEAALEQFELVSESGGALVLNNLAWLYFENSDERALPTMERALALEPANPEYMHSLGWMLFQTGSVERSIPYLKQSAELSPANGRSHYRLGFSLLQNGQRREAQAALRRALELGSFPEIQHAQQLYDDLTGA